MDARSLMAQLARSERERGGVRAWSVPRFWAAAAVVLTVVTLYLGALTQRNDSLTVVPRAFAFAAALVFTGLALYAWIRFARALGE